MQKKNSVLDFISGWFAFPRDHAATQVILRCSSSCLARCYKCNHVTRLVCVGLKHHCQDDAEADRQEGGGHVVEHRPAADLPAQPQVQGADGGDEAGHDEGDDQTLQHVQEDLARVANVVSLSGSVDSITNRF